MRQMRWIGVVGDADELRSGDFSRGLGATTETLISQDLETKEKKESRFKLCWLKKDTN